MSAPRKYVYDDDRLIAEAGDHPSIAQLAKAHGVSANALVKYLDNYPAVGGPVRAAIGGRAAEAAGPTAVEFEGIDLGDARKLIESRGMSADDWTVARARVNEYGKAKCPVCEADVGPYTQLRVDLNPRRDMLMPARKQGPAWTWPKDRPTKPGESIAFLGDPHCPHDDRRALAAFRAWLDRIGGVQRIVVLGDVLDLPTLSRWPKQPGQPNGNDCLEAGYEWLRELRAMAPDTPITWLVGNHDVRIENTARDNAPELMQLRRRGVGEHLLGLGYALGLDELAVDLVSPQEGWEVGELSLTPKLAAWHAPPSKRQREVLTYSVVHAHHHAMTWDTTPQLGQGNVTLGRKQVVGVASMASVRTGMGYTKAPRWGQGWAWADVWDDGEHEISHVRYHDGTAWWPGGRLRVR